MTDKLFGHDFDKNVEDLSRMTEQWFMRNRNKDLAEQFSQYVAEAQTGKLGQYFGRVLDGSLECIIGVLPVMANSLTSAAGRVIKVSRSKLKQLFSMIVYWLIQFHSGHPGSIPVKAEILDITNGILSSKVHFIR
ncbi:hypothetical protein HF650_24995 (plasmid) [Kosakonia sp. SMBL-WEM22]|uniref:hypothetical protein n=1 Tax=Kosakonia sp. SMBL-WEM22 TaxID=2725560 RepID=UPI001659EE29|nr:hypothetical protein [Kosakonia sp. SMBL-WEM22]QNQ23012.1 hypothetical protein HF650_24995 [Kosakonia sp. SMBL-WEM22]